MTNKTCPLGDDCDLTTAWMSGSLDAQRKMEAERDTAIAAAYEAAAKVADKREAVCWDADKKNLGTMERHCALEAKHIAEKIRALTPADAIAARDADRARVRREAMEEVRNRILGFTMIVPPNSVPMREACESIRGQAARVIRAMIEEEENG